LEAPSEQTRRDSVASRRDSVASRRDSVDSRRDSVASHRDTSTSVPVNAVQDDVFPTEARMKAKAKKAADPTLKAVKRKKKTELSYDECGEDHRVSMYIDEINHNVCDFVCFSGYKQN
jgi:hypothetical protein